MVSIIVPAYNIAPYIVECLESIKLQTYKDFEVILIDDGSTDNTYQACESFIEKNGLNNKFRLIRKDNGGVVAARIEALKLACGDWVMFVDGDDTLEAEALNTLTGHITDEINIIIGTFNYYINGEKHFSPNKSLGLYDAHEYINLILYGKIYVAPWAKLYRKSLLKPEMLELPRNIKNKEDFIMNMRIACSQKGKVLFIDNAIYNYRYGRPGSALTKYITQIDLQYELTIKKYVIEALKRYGVYNEHRKYVSYYYFDSLWYWRHAYKNLTFDKCNELLAMLKFSMTKDKTIKSLVKFIIIKYLLTKEKLSAKSKG